MKYTHSEGFLLCWSCRYINKNEKVLVFFTTFRRVFIVQIRRRHYEMVYLTYVYITTRFYAISINIILKIIIHKYWTTIIDVLITDDRNKVNYCNMKYNVSPHTLGPVFYVRRDCNHNHWQISEIANY